ncbi:MAG: ScpA family protein [Synechococcales cyanobacterium]
MNLTDAAISLLLELAEQGEIDPWDVQVIDVVDRFLTQLAPTASTRDLGESGQAFLYAAMLVYLKAMALGQSPTESEDLIEEWVDESPPWHPAVPLESLIRPRAVPRIQRTRPITLRDLIDHMQTLDALLQPKDKPARPPRLSRQQALSAIRELAHPENLSENVSVLSALLHRVWGQMPQIEFDALVQHYAQGSPITSGQRVQVFWGLLLMASQSQVELHQQDFYGPLQISPCPVPPLVEPLAESA